MTQRIEKKLLIKNKLGLHARAATKLVMLVNKFDAEVMIEHQGKSASAASVMGLLMMETCMGQEIQVVAEGDEAQQALDAVESLINDRFDENE
ncbi:MULTISPECIES: HPr family phosphocarrier protein [Corallincola]|uniref:HPr family phosphocarrier protein n=3 Tax=Corallincola TaxID=1775176 RepID=A0A368NGX8_9GAMM|nr:MULTISPECIES: HPr family phosphocarrier protein [Corallincola]RCU49847.1 HPr family phosphocarrier protein [Corallincola holothuriorum]TAA45176.1 HPr family phosphocarrier protein [Corallincola spongiicola]TCI03547.1 HPr family phosphocarrier protein [Corallincola luteus]